MPDHSFAVMAYKDSPYLNSCLESLTRQKEKSMIFITTSTPSDYINTIAKKFGVEVFVNEHGNGIADDWNFALHKAKTKYVTLAHQDDIYLPEYSTVCVAAAEKFRDFLICFTDYGEIRNNSDRRKNLILQVKQWMLFFSMPFKKNIQSGLWKRLMLSLGNSISCPSVMYNMDLIMDFNFSTEYSINLDWEAWYRLSKMKGRFVYIPKVLMKHRIHSQSETTAGLKDNKRQMEDFIMFQKFWPKPIAKLLVKLYAGSYKSNEIKEPI